MGTFNDIYYSFSPIVSDYERENPLFKEAVKIAITPMTVTISNEKMLIQNLCYCNYAKHWNVSWNIVVVGIRKIR